MHRSLLMAAAALLIALPAAAQTGTANVDDAGMSESGGQSAVYQAATACTAAMRYEAVETGEIAAQTAADRMAELAVSSGQGLGMEAEEVQEQLTGLTETYAQAAAENPQRHRRMVAQCGMLAGSANGGRP